MSDSTTRARGGGTRDGLPNENEIDADSRGQPPNQQEDQFDSGQNDPYTFLRRERDRSLSPLSNASASQSFQSYSGSYVNRSFPPPVDSPIQGLRGTQFPPFQEIHRSGEDFHRSFTGSTPRRRPSLLRPSAQRNGLPRAFNLPQNVTARSRPSNRFSPHDPLRMSSSRASRSRGSYSNQSTRYSSTGGHQTPSSTGGGQASVGGSRSRRSGATPSAPPRSAGGAGGSNATKPPPPPPTKTPPRR